MKKYFIFGAVLFVILSCGQHSMATVVDSTQSGFTVRHEKIMMVNADTLYTIFTKQIDKWWDPEHTWSGKAENVYIQPYVGGCFGERWENGGATSHMNVIYTDPGKIFRMSGGLGPLQSYAVTGILTLEIKAYGDESRVSLTYAVGGYIPGGVNSLAEIVDQVLGGQFGRFVKFAEKKK
jgi:hypothetical protein